MIPIRRIAMAALGLSAIRANAAEVTVNTPGANRSPGGMLWVEATAAALSLFGTRRRGRLPSSVFHSTAG